ncbi:hypothetical protein AB0C04_31480 [Micromonospora sp. NPDC048909]|uniref:hypothetical protein n=1 Tax=Micromonospora sp. NPDC048909 TaxID=3155643 RepID=UPI0033F7F409
MPSMSKADLFAAIRRDSRAGLSMRALARKYQVSRRTVRSALSSGWPAPRKQRHTVKRIYDRLIAEHDMHDVPHGRCARHVIRKVALPSRPATDGLSDQSRTLRGAPRGYPATRSLPQSLSAVQMAGPTPLR